VTIDPHIGIIINSTNQIGTRLKNEKKIPARTETNACAGKM
jgi:hypothetical protein